MGFEVNGPNNIHGVKVVSTANEVKENSFLNTVFGNKNNNFVPHTAFNGEEQHVLGIFANTQDFVLIED